MTEASAGAPEEALQLVNGCIWFHEADDQGLPLASHLKDPTTSLGLRVKPYMGARSKNCKNLVIVLSTFINYSPTKL